MNIKGWVGFTALAWATIMGCVAEPASSDAPRRATFERLPTVPESSSTCDDMTLADELGLELGPMGPVISTDPEECEQYAFAGDERCAELVAEAGLSVSVAFFATPDFEACGCTCAEDDIPQGPARECAADFSLTIEEAGLEGYSVLESGLLVIEQGDDCDGTSAERCERFAMENPELDIDWVVHEIDGEVSCGCQCDCVPIGPQLCGANAPVFTNLECQQDSDCCSEFCNNGFCMECP